MGEGVLRATSRTPRRLLRLRRPEPDRRHAHPLAHHSCPDVALDGGRLWLGLDRGWRGQRRHDAVARREQRHGLRHGRLVRRLLFLLLCPPASLVLLALLVGGLLVLVLVADDDGGGGAARDI